MTKEPLKENDRVKGIYNGFLKYEGNILYVYPDGDYIVQLDSGRQITITHNEDTIEKISHSD